MTTNQEIKINSASVLTVSNAILGKGPRVDNETYKAHVPKFVSKKGKINIPGETRETVEARTTFGGYASRDDQDKFGRLRLALAKTALPQNNGSTRKVSETEFMYMGSGAGGDTFKHCSTRCRVTLANDGQLNFEEDGIYDNY